MFDKYFNLADPSSEIIVTSFSNSPDGSTYKDVAISSKIIQSVSLISFFFYTPSSGLKLNIQHNGTLVPPSNFVPRNLQIIELIETLQISGFQELLLGTVLNKTQAVQFDVGAMSMSSTNNSKVMIKSDQVAAFSSSSSLSCFILIL
jgi:hypothetical protein